MQKTGWGKSFVYFIATKLLREAGHVPALLISPSYAGGSSRVDFLLKPEQIVVEVKKTRASMKAKDLGEQLIIDRARYESHPDCKTLVCFVYDPEGRIGNPVGIERDLERHWGGLGVRVIIAPKG